MSNQADKDKKRRYKERADANREGAADFGAKLTAAREARGFGRYEAARRCGIDDTNYAKIEEGVTEPRWHTIKAIIEGLRLDLTYFFPPNPVGRHKNKEIEI